MIIFPAQWEAFRTRGDGTRILSFSTYSKDAEEVSKITNSEIGQEYIIMAIPSDSEEAQSFVSETKEETTERFYKRMHALISEIANIKGIKPEDFKETIKAKLKLEGKIKESTKELDVEGLAKVIIRLKKIRDDLK